LQHDVKMLKMELGHDAPEQSKSAFLCRLEHALLLALNEQGSLTQLQYQRAEKEWERTHKQKWQENKP